MQRFYSYATDCFEYLYDNKTPKIDLCIFQDDALLRQHVAKHLLSEKEWTKSWSKLDNKVKFDNIEETIIKLIEVGCPYYKTEESERKKRFENPPCESCFKSNENAKCDVILDSWEEIYVRAIDKCVKRGFQHPLFAIYEKKGESYRRMAILSSIHKVFIHSSVVSNFFNVRSARSYNDHNKIKDKILRESKRNSSVFYIPDTWNNQLVDWKKTLLKLKPEPK